MKGGGVMDSAIKLFGRRIPLPVYSHLPASSGFDAASLIPDPSEYMEAEGGSEIVQVEAENPSVADSDQNAHHVTPKEEKQQQGFSETTSSGEADQGTKLQPKKPNKILACPRCSSTDTKFCYFNNYNVNQPRHFCKHCQRYWTAGGTMRNVPIGAGRRKNKQLAATQYHQIILSASDALCPTHTATTTTTTNTDNNNLGNGITVLKFGSESTATVLNVSDQNCYGANCRGNYPMHCSYPIPMAMNTNFDVAVPRQNAAAAEAQQGSGLVYPHNCGNGLGPYQLCSPQMLGVPGFCAPSIPVQFIPVPAVAPHWGCMPVWAGGGVENATAMNGFSSPHVSGSTSNGFQILGPYTRNSTSVFHEKRVDQSVLGSSEMTRVNGSSHQAGSTSYICSAEVRGRPR